MVRARAASRYAEKPTSTEMIMRGDPTNAMAEFGVMFEKWLKRGGGLTLMHAPAVSPSMLLSRLRRELINMQSEGRKPDYVFLDYLQRVSFGKELTNGKNMVNVISEFIDDWVALIISFGGIPVILSQVSVDQNGDAYTKDARSATEKAQFVVSIERSVIKNPENIERANFIYEGKQQDETLAGLKQRSYIANFRLLKNTSGPLGSVEVIHNPNRFSFFSISYLYSIEKDSAFKYKVPILEKADKFLVDRVNRKAAAVQSFTDEQIEKWRKQTQRD
jgi:hypothetical protein